MTLVAAFPLRGIPMLMGDFLLTDNQENVKHDFIPTKPELQNIKPGSKKRRIAGLRKKIHKISGRFVVGFTGNITPGRVLIKALSSQFTNRVPSISELEEFLDKVVIKDKAYIELVGWICEKRPLCFYWSGKEPSKINTVDHKYAGSGWKHFEKVIMNAAATGFSDELKTELERATFEGIAIMGKVLADELMQAGTLSNDYGFSAEMLIWDGNKFNYIDKLAYVFWNIIVTEDNSLFIKLANVVAVYKNFNTYSVLQVTHLGPNNTNTGLESKDTFYNIIHPLNDLLTKVDVSKTVRLTLESNYWFTGISVTNVKKNIHSLLTFASDNVDENGIAYYKDGKMKLRVELVMEKMPAEIFN